MSSYLPTNEINDQAVALRDTAKIRTRDNKYQIAIGVFDQLSSLVTAVDALFLSGFTTRDLCVMGTADTLMMAGSIIQAETSLNLAVLSLLDNDETRQLTDEEPAVVGSQGRLLSVLKDEMQQCRKFDRSNPSNVRYNLSASIVANSLSGRLTLIVDTDEPQQIIHAAKALLQYSPHSVQTHDF